MCRQFQIGKYAANFGSDQNGKFGLKKKGGKLTKKNASVFGQGKIADKLIGLKQIWVCQVHHYYT